MSLMESLLLGDMSYKIGQFVHELAKADKKDLSKKSYASRVKEQIRKETHVRKTLQSSFDQYQKSVKHGIELIQSEGFLKKIDNKKFLSFMKKIGSQDFSGIIFQEELGISNDEITSFYKCGVSYFEKNNLERLLQNS